MNDCRMASCFVNALMWKWREARKRISIQTFQRWRPTIRLVGSDRVSHRSVFPFAFSSFPCEFVRHLFRRAIQNWLMSCVGLSACGRCRCTAHISMWAVEHVLYRNGRTVSRNWGNWRNWRISQKRNWHSANGIEFDSNIKTNDALNSISNRWKHSQMDFYFRHWHRRCGIFRVLE